MNNAEYRVLMKPLIEVGQHDVVTHVCIRFKNGPPAAKKNASMRKQIVLVETFDFY